MTDNQPPSPKLDEAFYDIADAILALRLAFQRHRLTPPTRLELGAPGDMRELRASIPSDMVVDTVVVGTRDNPVSTLNICGMEIIAPTQMRAVRGRHGRVGYEYE
jgi:hypothetical protein